MSEVWAVIPPSLVGFFVQDLLTASEFAGFPMDTFSGVWGHFKGAKFATSIYILRIFLDQI